MANSINYDFRVLDRFSGPLGKMVRSMGKMTNAVSRASTGMSNLGKKLRGVGDNLSTVQSAIAGIGAGVAFKGLVGATNEFYTSMNNVEAITRSSESQMLSLRKQAKMLGAETQFSAAQAADAMGFLGMAGLNTEQIMKAMPGTLQLAAAGGLDLASAADIATNVLAQMGMEVGELNKVNDALAFTASSANTNVYEMAEALKNVGGTASGLGFNLATVTALLGKMADSGSKGGEAGTLLRNAMTRLVKPSAKALKVFRKLHINLKEFTTPDGKIKNFTGLIKSLGDQGATIPDIYNIFEEQGGRAIVDLLKAGGPAIDKLKEKIGAAGGAAETMAKVKMKGLPGAIKRAQSAFEGLKITMGEALMPTVIKFLETLSSMMSWLQTSAPGLTTFAVVALTAVAAIGALAFPVGIFISGLGTVLSLVSVVSPAILALTGIVKAFSLALVANPIGLIVVGITAAIAAIWRLIDAWDELKIAWTEGGFFKAAATFFGFGGDTEESSKTTAASAIKTRATEQNVNVGGTIKVAAEPGTKVTNAMPDLNAGPNMRYAY